MDLSRPAGHSENNVKRLIVFRFHKAPLVCRSRIALLRRLNPDVPICGLFGGPHGIRGAAFRVGGKNLLGLNASSGCRCSPRYSASRWSTRVFAVGGVERGRIRSSISGVTRSS
jgi:hypothetical protein